MVHADCRDTPGKRQRTGKATTDQQRPEQARPRGTSPASRSTCRTSGSSFLM